MAVDIGPKIGIQGEAEFRRELQSINQGLKTLGSEMNVVTSSFIGNENSVEALTAKNDVLDRTILSLNEKLAAQQKMLKKYADAYGEADSRTQKMQQSVNKTQTEINKLTAQIDANTQRIQYNGKTAEEAVQELKKEDEENRRLQESFRGVGETVKTLSSEMAVVTSQYINNEKSAEALTAKNDLLEKTNRALNERLEVQKGLLAQAQEEYGETSNEALRWQQEINKTTAAINKNNAEIQKNNEALNSSGSILQQVGSTLTNKLGSALGLTTGQTQQLTAAFTGASGEMSSFAASGIAAVGVVAAILKIIRAMRPERTNIYDTGRADRESGGGRPAEQIKYAPYQ